MDLVEIATDLRAAANTLRFGEPVEHVYNPLDYAWDPHTEYTRLYGSPPKTVLLVGMNPGPWGMAQTGVPFGEIAAVRDWLGIEATVGTPTDEHPKRPVTGFQCSRSEVSGRRVWAWARDRFGTPRRFFDHFYIANYCPLLFLDRDGRNLTPDKLRAADRRPLEEICDETLRRIAECLGVDIVVGLGKFSADRARQALVDTPVRVGRILHPSPANPAANRGWAEAVDRQFAEMGIALPGRDGGIRALGRVGH
jgi:single-strand selective monofunctional uracil DNA glycosylase